MDEDVAARGARMHPRHLHRQREHERLLHDALLERRAPEPAAGLGHWLRAALGRRA